MHELSIASAIVATAARHAGGRRVAVVSVRVGRLRQVIPDSLEFCFGFVARETVCEGARLDLEIVPAALRCAACAHAWELPSRRSGARPAPGATSRQSGARSWKSSRSRSKRRRHASNVREGARGRPRRQRHARPREPRGLRPRGRHGRESDEQRPAPERRRVLERVVASLPGVRVGVLEGDVRGTLDADRIASLHVPVTQINTDPSFGGECHLDANMVRSALRRSRSTRSTCS